MPVRRDRPILSISQRNSMNIEFCNRYLAPSYPIIGKLSETWGIWNSLRITALPNKQRFRLTLPNLPSALATCGLGKV